MTLRKYNISLNLVQECVKSDTQMKAIALYYKVKMRFVNGKVYEYTPNKLAKELNLSPYLVKKFVPVMIEMNLASLQAQHNAKEGHAMIVLCLTGIDKVKAYRQDKLRRRIYISQDFSLKDIIFKLKAESIKNFLKRQVFVRGCKSDLALKNKPCPTMSKDELKKFKKRLKDINRYGNDGEICNDLFLSSRKLYYRFGIIPSDFKNFRKFTTTHLKWTWSRLPEYNEQCDKEAFEFAKPKYRFAHKYYAHGRYCYVFPYTVSVRLL